MNERTTPIPEWLPRVKEIFSRLEGKDINTSERQLISDKIAEIYGPDAKAKAEEMFAAQASASLDKMLNGLTNKSAAVLGALTTQGGPAPVSASVGMLAGFQHSIKPTGIVSSVANGMEAIRVLGIRCAYDTFHNKLIINGHPTISGGDTVENLDMQALLFRGLVLRETKIELSKDHAFDALKISCLSTVFDPVRDYLDSLQWDGVPRIDRWLIDYCGAEDTPLNRAIGRKMLIAGVRRVRSPGCKFDYITVLEGPQGCGKSTLIKLLAGEENFSDAQIIGVPDKEQQALATGVWLYEIAELVGLGRADTRAVKVFASKTTDRARAAYDRDATTRKRRCIFVATTNDDKYLRDPTGNRRFWPVKIGVGRSEDWRVDLDGIADDRDQLWAEASQAEADGEALTIPDDLLAAIRNEQSARMEVDPWTDPITAAIRDEQNRICKAPNGHYGFPGKLYLHSTATGEWEWRVSSQWLLSDVLKLSGSQLQKPAYSHLSDVMRVLDWHHADKPIRIGSVLCRGFTKLHGE